MNKKPILTFQNYKPTTRHGLSSGIPKLKIPAKSRQFTRLDPKFKTLENLLVNGKLEVRDDYSGAVPETVVVLEIAGTIKDFNKAVQKVDGLKFVGSFAQEGILPDADFYDESNATKPLGGCLYMVISNNQGMHELLQLWKRWHEGTSDKKERLFKHGQGKWKDLFNQLKDVREWGPEDRVRETGLLEDWKERQEEGKDIVQVEVELWFREDRIAADNAANKVINQIKAEQGRVVGNPYYLKPIAYHAILCELPIGAVGGLFTQQTKLVRSESIMFFRPGGQISAGQITDFTEEEIESEPSTGTVAIEPIVGLFDGLPLQNHEKLANRLIIDDPDSWEIDYPVKERLHGTAMASLILHGELDAKEPSLSRPIYVRPILKPNPKDFVNERREERIPDSLLIVDFLHQAVRRLFESVNGEPPVAPTVKIINFSVGDPNYVFHSVPSPLARLLDWLSWKYKVLFIVSAGNYGETIDIDEAEWEKIKNQPDVLKQKVLQFVRSKSPFYRLLSPAESVNSLTIGALHLDKSNNDLKPNQIDPYLGSNNIMPSPFNAHGLGYHKAVKPELFFPGGRSIYNPTSYYKNGSKVRLHLQHEGAPGQAVASPSAQPGKLNAKRYIRGTSNATALASRSAARLYEVISSIQEKVQGENINSTYTTLLVKALLAHSASWNGTQDELLSILTENAQSPKGPVEYKKYKARVSSLLGYGSVDIEKVFFCTEQRVTLLSWANLSRETAHTYSLPLPPSLSSIKTYRKLVVTLAWFTPTNCQHQNYRMADLWVAPYGDDKEEGTIEAKLKASRKEVDWQTARLGTLQHEIFEGDKATPFEENDYLQLQVNCRENAGKLEEPVPYALAVTLEVAPETNLPIYTEIEALIRTSIKVKTPNSL